MQVGIIELLKAVFNVLLPELCAESQTIRESAVHRAMTVGGSNTPMLFLWRQRGHFDPWALFIQHETRIGL